MRCQFCGWDNPRGEKTIVRNVISLYAIWTKALRLMVMLRMSV